MNRVFVGRACGGAGRLPDAPFTIRRGLQFQEISGGSLSSVSKPMLAGIYY